MNALKRWYVYTVSFNFTVANTSQRKNLQVSSEFDFVIQKITSRQTATDFTARVINSEYQWSNRAIQQPNFSGNAQYPAICLEPIKVPKNTNIEIEVVNGATATNNIYLVFEGYLTQDMSQLINTGRNWYQYAENYAFTGANEQTIMRMRISSHNNFIVQKLVVNATATDYRIDIIDANEKWTQNYIYGSALIGTAQRPNILMTPIVVLANSSIIFQLINGATASNPLQLCLEGYLEGAI